MGASIVIADDERNITDVCRRYLEREGFTVWVAANGEEALHLWREHQPDLLVLDLMMPKLSGIEVCDQIRRTEDTPVIILTARGEEADRLLGLTMGADDYITKPFSPRELVLRVKNILRRTGANVESVERELTSSIEKVTEQALHFDGLAIFPQERRVMVKDVETELTVKEFDLLHLLSLYPGKVFSRSQLLNQVWDVTYDGDTTTVTVHIRRLREKIEENPSEPGWIKTVWGIGYKLEGKVGGV